MSIHDTLKFIRENRYGTNAFRKLDTKSILKAYVDNRIVYSKIGNGLAIWSLNGRVLHIHQILCKSKEAFRDVAKQLINVGLSHGAVKAIAFRAKKNGYMVYNKQVLRKF